MSAPPRVSLGELLKLERRPVVVEPDREYQEIGVYCFGRGIFHKEPRTGLEVGSKKLFRIREGDLIFQVTFAWEGAVALARAAEDELYGSSRFTTFRVDESRAVPAYLSHYFRTHDGRQQLVAISPGSAGRNRVLSLKRIPQVTVPLPPLAEQRRIVARIDDLVAKVEEAQRLRKQALAEAKSFVSSLHVHLSGSRVVTMSDLVALDEEHVPVAVGEEYPQVGIRGFGGGMFPRPAVEGSQTTYKHFNRLYAGALVLSQVKGWEGAIAVCPNGLVGWFASPEYRTFRCNQGQAVPEYLAALVSSPWFWTRLANITRGMGGRRERTRPERFLAMELPFPSVEAQEKAVRLLGKIAAIQPLQSGTAAELDALLPSILDKAFKGEL